MTTHHDTELDAELVERTLAGDERAAACLIDRHLGAVRRVFSRKIAAPDIIDDLTQEALLGCFNQLAKLARPECFRPWLLRIAQNKLHDHFRATGRARVRVVDYDGSWEIPCERAEAAMRALEGEDDERMLAAALAELSPRSQLLMRQFYWHELPRGEIAAALGIPVGTVGSRLAHVRKQLGKSILARRSGTESPPAVDSV